MLDDVQKCTICFLEACPMIEMVRNPDLLGLSSKTDRLWSYRPLQMLFKLADGKT